MLKSRNILVTLLCLFTATVSAGVTTQTTTPTTTPTTTQGNSLQDRAGNEFLILTLPGQAPVQLAAADMAAPTMKASNTLMDKDKPVFKDRMFTANKIHKYLGIGSIALATLAAISPKEEDGPHEYFARGAATLAGAAMATGFTFHHEDITLKNGFRDPDNLHALLTSVGTLGYVLAVSNAPDAHAGYGIGGMVSMVIGIKLTW